jgi:hypothetical protein
MDDEDEILDLDRGSDDLQRDERVNWNSMTEF